MRRSPASSRRTSAGRRASCWPSTARARWRPAARERGGGRPRIRRGEAARRSHRRGYVRDRTHRPHGQTSTTDADSALRSISLVPSQGRLSTTRSCSRRTTRSSETNQGTWSSSSRMATRPGARRLSRTRSPPRRARAPRLRRRHRKRQVQPGTAPPDRRGDGRKLLWGSRHGGADGVYNSIADELSRTWRLEYVTSALPSETIDLTAIAGGRVASSRSWPRGRP